IVEPNDTVGFTEGRGINNSRTVCGDYATSDGNLHGFFLSGGTFTEYDVPGAVFTAVLGINNPADFAGTFVDGSGIQQAFVSVGGTLTLFSVPAAIATLAYDINDSKRLVVGYYIDSSGILHGYYRDANGALHFPIDPPGSVGTILFGDNNRNWGGGRYADASGVTHGLFFVPPNNFFTFDFPGSTFTSLNGISSQGNITGRYLDAACIAHGFIARVRGTPPTKAAGPEMKPNSPSLVAPLNPSPSAGGGGMPARSVEHRGGLRGGPFVQIRADDEWPPVVPETQSGFHRHAQQNAFHCRGVHQQSRSFRPSRSMVATHPKLQPALLRLSAINSR